MRIAALIVAGALLAAPALADQPTVQWRAYSINDDTVGPSHEGLKALIPFPGMGDLAIYEDGTVEFWWPWKKQPHIPEPRMSICLSCFG